MADGRWRAGRSATILSRPHCWHLAGPAASTQQHGSARRLRGQSSPMSLSDKPGKALPRTVESQAIAGASPAACNFLMEVEVVARVQDRADLVISCKSAQTRQSEDDPSIAQHQHPKVGSGGVSGPGQPAAVETGICGASRQCSRQVCPALSVSRLPLVFVTPTG